MCKKLYNLGNICIDRKCFCTENLSVQSYLKKGNGAQTSMIVAGAWSCDSSRSELSVGSTLPFRTLPIQGMYSTTELGCQQKRYIQIRPPIGIKIRPFSSSKISPIKFLLSYDRPIKSIFLWKIVTSLSWFFISDLVGLKNRKYLENPNLGGP